MPLGCRLPVRAGPSVALRLAAEQDLVGSGSRRRQTVRHEAGPTAAEEPTVLGQEQQVRYDDYAKSAARLTQIAKRRPLTPKEFDRLQMLLACMRMICDTPAILDPTCRVSPKLEELERILEDLLRDPDRKIIIFSEWERMLDLVRELAGEMGVEAAWHTGSVPQIRRREEINRFKQDPACRLFLSTDSGSVGLNLQAASAVINLDLPWNPAKLEQRIARAWRKHQTRSVTVINLVSEKTIEHSILHLLDAKQALSDGLLDGQGEIGALKMPSGRGALIERMRSMLEGVETLGPRVVRPEEGLAARPRERHGEQVLRIEARTTPEGAIRLLAILDLDPQALAAEEALLRDQGVPVEIVDRASWLALRRLAAAGMVGLTGGEARVLYATAEFADAAPAPVDASRTQASAWRDEAERSIRMANVLTAGGFPEEAPAQFAKAIRCLAAARRRMAGDAAADPAATDPEEIRALAGGCVPSAEITSILAGVSPGAAPPTAAEAAKLAGAISRPIAGLWPEEMVPTFEGPSSEDLAA